MPISSSRRVSGGAAGSSWWRECYGALSTNPGDRTLVVETIRFPVSDVAVADARYEITGAGGSATRRMWSTFVAVRTPEGWRLSAIRNMLPTR